VTHDTCFQESTIITPKRAGFFQRFWPVLKQRCPNCLEGKVFSGMLKMFDTCPACGFVYEREPGYFTGAMYISYGIAVFTLIPTVIILYFLALPTVWSFSIVALQLVVTSPLIVRYSRILWLHLDQMLFPDKT
jgi:uncharacterized protein (DUF983 family)